MKTSIVYLIHFDRPYHHAQHYIGSTNNLEARLNAHMAGQGARLLEVVLSAGITFSLVRTWPGDRRVERKLKKQKHAARFCPICNQKLANNK